MSNRIDKYTETSKIRDTYSDFSVDLSPHPNTQDLMRATNEAAIKRSIRNLISTNLFERPFQPKVGSKIRNLLFENASDELAGLIQTYCRETIDNYEPRVKVISVDAIYDDANNAYKVNIFFYIINKTEPVGLSIILYRVR